MVFIVCYYFIIIIIGSTIIIRNRGKEIVNADMILQVTEDCDREINTSLPLFFLTLLQNLLTKTILRDMMYNVKGGIVWIFS